MLYIQGKMYKRIENPGMTLWPYHLTGAHSQLTLEAKQGGDRLLLEKDICVPMCWYVCTWYMWVWRPENNLRVHLP